MVKEEVEIIDDNMPSVRVASECNRKRKIRGLLRIQLIAAFEEKDLNFVSVIRTLTERRLAPLLVFCMSRMECELRAISVHHMDFTTGCL